jgi:hypothetical protein
LSFRAVDCAAKTSDNDYIAKTGTLTFAPRETMKTITIEVEGDSKKDADETFTSTCSAMAATRRSPKAAALARSERR